MATLSEKVAVITGSSRGFGLEIARSFLREGAQVVISSRSQAAIDQALQALDQPDRVIGTPCDVSQLTQVQALRQFALDRFGKLDIWVNNAGSAGPYGPVLGISPDSFKSVINTNIVGTYHGSMVALQHFVPLKQGKLINILGHGAKNAVPYQSPYSASKIWIRSFTESLIVENKGSSVSIFGFNPGMMDTELLTKVDVVEGSEHRLKAFPTVIRILARPAYLPADELVRLVSSTTDGQPGKIIYSTAMGYALENLVLGLFKSKKQKKEVSIEMNVLPFGKA